MDAHTEAGTKRRPVTPEVVNDEPEPEEDEVSGNRGESVAQEVVSEVNTFFVSATERRPILKDNNRITKLSFAVAAKSSTSSSTALNASTLQYDQDGDPILPRKPKYGETGVPLEDKVMYIEYENSTTLDLVGLQVWRGAFVLADFTIHSSIVNPALFQGKTVLELGSGTGLSSIVAAMYSKRVIATDLNDPNILNLIQANVTHNQDHITSEFEIKALDFLDLSWSQDLEKCIEEADIILAADVVYHERITEAFLQTLKKCLLSGKLKEVFIALEKRYVFTLADLDIVAPAYYFFMEQLESVLGLSLSSFSERDFSARTTTSLRSVQEEQPVPVIPETSILTSAGGGGKTMKLSIVPVSLKFHDLPQYFCYERTKDLVLWHIKSTRV